MCSIIIDQFMKTRILSTCINIMLFTQVISAQLNNKQLLNPFLIEIDPMERLLLVNFESDPDTLYIGFEPQVFDDDINGRGHLVIGWRVDGKVDVYHEPGLRLDKEKYDITGKGLANMIELTMPKASFDINEFGVQADYQFYDIHNREVVIKIAENNPKKRKPFGLLAPMGDAAENPSAMPLVLLHDFYFVRRKHTETEVSINGKQHQIDNLPVPMDGTRMTFIRYSPRPLIATFNPAFDGELPYQAALDGTERVWSEGNDVILVWKDGNPFISSITFNNETHPVELRFDNPFPDITTLEDNTSQKGRFEIEADHSTGRITGHYTVEKQGGQAKIVLIPSGGWKPRPDKLSLRFLYTAARVFKKWPATYEWTATVRVQDDGSYHMVSGWKRIR